MSLIALFLSLNLIAAENGNYRIDLDHSSVSFNVSHLMIGLVAGRFNDFSGNFQLDSNGGSSVSVEIQTASIDTNQSRRDNHLRSADFLDATRFPKMKFISNRVEMDEQNNPAKIHGNLTLHGVTKEVTLAVTPLGAGDGPFGNYRAGFTATATIQRSEYGMANLLAVAGDQIDITIHIEGIRN